MQQDSKKGRARTIRALLSSIDGLAAACRHEAAFRQELLLCAVLIPLAFWLGDSATERALLISSLLIVLIAELLNSGIEAAIDRIGIERHPLSGRAKDLGSAAVFVAILNSTVVWLLIILS